MPFAREAPRMPQGIGEMVITLVSPDPATGASPNLTYRITVTMDDGSARVQRGDLADLITPQRRTSLIALLDALRDQATQEALPVSAAQPSTPTGGVP